MKQIPLVFSLMTGKKKVDYILVLNEVKKLLGPDSVPKEFVLDYESAIWGAVQRVFPDSSLKGCSYHLSQAIWRHIQELGLQPSYINDSGSQLFCRKLMAIANKPVDEGRRRSKN